MRVAAMFRTVLGAGLLLGAAADAAPSPGPGRAGAEGSLAQHPRVRQALTFLELWLDAERAYEGIPGISVAVVHDQELLWARGFGFADRERQRAATPGTVYSICSISKLFTSIALMQLRDAGKLRLDDPVAWHLPWFAVKQMHPESDPITIESLLTHSAGLQEDPSFPYWTGKFEFPTRQQIVERLPLEETIYPAQRYFEYSNLGLILAGEIVAEVSGAPYADRVRRKILEPLGLDSTSPEMPARLRGGRLANGYAARDRNGERAPVPFFQARGVAPASGFASTVEDLARFAAWQFRVIGTGGTEVLTAKTLREMHRVHFTDPDWSITRGLGFRVWRDSGRTFVGHSGDCPGYRSALLLQPEERVAIVFMANANGVASEALSQRMYEIVAPAIRAARATPDARPGADYAALQGSYDFQPWGGELLVFPWEEDLALLHLPSQQPLQELIRLHAVDGSPLHFRMVREHDVAGEPIDFELGPDGRALRMLRWNNPFPRLPQRRAPGAAAAQSPQPRERDARLQEDPPQEHR
jgi:CubicO group peptidase (beta-lactamase class C family)